MSTATRDVPADFIGRSQPFFDYTPSSSASPAFVSELMGVLPQVRAYAMKLSGRAADAEDLVQETCRRALEAHKRFAPGSNLRGWLLCILRNHHRDRLRRGGREIALGDGIDTLPASVPEEGPPAPWKVVSDEDTDLALGSLPPVFKTTYLLYAVQGLSYAEIAADLGIPAATVGTRLRRARCWLHQFLIQRIAAQTVAEV